MADNESGIAQVVAMLQEITGTVRTLVANQENVDFRKAEVERVGIGINLRTEFCNVTNTPMLNIPYTGLNFKLGIIDRSPGERNVQFALKPYFQLLGA